MSKTAENKDTAQGAKSSAKGIDYTCNHKMWFAGEPASIDLRKASQKQLGILKKKYPQHFKP